MSRKNKIIFASIIILTIVVVIICIYSIVNKKSVNSDALKFRNEYMNLNDKVNEVTGKDYLNVIISESNTVKYLDEEETIKLLESGNGIVYFGYPTSSACRNLVSILSDIMESKNKTLYYLNIYDIRSAFKIEEGKLNKIKVGSNNYYKILNILENYLEDYYLEDEAGNIYNTKEKLLTAPTLVAIKNGKIIDVHIGLLDSKLNNYDELTKEEKEEIKKIVSNMLDKYSSVDMCTREKC